MVGLGGQSNAAPDQFSCCNRGQLSLISRHCRPPVKRREPGQRWRSQLPKTYRSQRFPLVKSCALLHSAIFGKPAGGGGTCCSIPFSIQGGSRPESRRTSTCGSIGGALDVRTFHESGI